MSTGRRSILTWIGVWGNLGLASGIFVTSVLLSYSETGRDTRRGRHTYVHSLASRTTTTRTTAQMKSSPGCHVGPGETENKLTLLQYDAIRSPTGRRVGRGVVEGRSRSTDRAGGEPRFRSDFSTDFADFGDRPRVSPPPRWRPRLDSTGRPTQPTEPGGDTGLPPNVPNPAPLSLGRHYPAPTIH